MKDLKFIPKSVNATNNDGEYSEFFKKLKAVLVFDIEKNGFDLLKINPEKKEEIEHAFLFAIHEVFRKHRKQIQDTFFRHLPTNPEDTDEEIINKFFVK